MQPPTEGSGPVPIEVFAVQRDGLTGSSIIEASVTFGACTVHRVRLVRSHRGTFVGWPSRRNAAGGFDSYVECSPSLTERIRQALAEVFEATRTPQDDDDDRARLHR